jgi:hypothetical protein
MFGGAALDVAHLFRQTKILAADLALARSTPDPFPAHSLLPNR